MKICVVKANITSIVKQADFWMIIGNATYYLLIKIYRHFCEARNTA